MGNPWGVAGGGNAKGVYDPRNSKTLPSGMSGSNYSGWLGPTDAGLGPVNYPGSGGDPGPTGGGGGGHGGGGGGTNWNWNSYGLDNVPSWWTGKTNAASQDTQYASMMNAMIPFMSEEDQRYAGSTLARMFKEFGSYNPLTNNAFTTPAVNMTDDMTRNYQNSKRARGMLQALTAMQQASGAGEEQWGPGYAWLQQLGDVMGDWGQSGATEMMTPVQQQQMLAALDPLLAESKGSGSAVSPYAELGRMLTQPFFSAGPLSPRTQGAQGQQVFGAPNPLLY
jgi:hypothetical protein